MVNKQEVLEIIRKTRVIAIVRGTILNDLEAIGEALTAGGVRAIEVSLTTPKALTMIEQLVDRHQADVVVGAGTVLDGETARAAVLAGASFLLAPSLSPKMVEVCHRYGILAIPGAMTPTEVVAAWEMGVHAVKLFPAGQLGPAYLKDLKGPLPQVNLIAVGGVSLENAQDFIRSGAMALGIGSELVDQRLVVQGRFETIRERASAFVAAVKAGREASQR
ncbi:MAG: bifunctional 4-hydroxy-2-oxoglutarate aldolase/2-dehydro-3-deoxy-phosphogluconate aldolase [Bacillota bacterium]|nr:bifunctional 4-hydroxy-2-oxoglutarate aldolase/2-dehydro-3-deoxy-phosphogluconate aldolase [Bacillota bacterium]